MSSASKQKLRKPSPLGMIAETRACLDVGIMALTSVSRGLRRSQPSRGRHVMLLPGFSSDDRYLIPLRLHLKKLGYSTEGWGLGFNKAGLQFDAQIEDLGSNWSVEPKEIYNGEASVPYLCQLATDRIKSRSEELGAPITLIGWSLGGYIAREAARDLPKEVDQVITMGAPVIGGPKYTTAAAFFKKRGMDLDWIEEEIEKREERPITQPITSIYSRTDGVVGWQAAIDHYSPNVEHIHVNAAHLGMGFNQKVWKYVVKALSNFDKLQQ